MFSKVSLKSRLTALFVVIFGSTLTAFGIFSFEFLSNSISKEFDDALYNYAIDVSESVALNPSGDLSIASANVDQAKIYPFSLGTALIQIRHRNGETLTQVGNFGKLNLPYKSDFERLSKGEDATYRTVNAIDDLPDAESDSYRVINFPLDESPKPQLILQIAVPLTFVEAQVDSRRLVFEIGIPLVILISTFSGYFLATRALAPVQEIIDRAHKFGVHDLTERLPVPTARDEIQSLAKTLNEMLSRIETSFKSQERFVADASHQLLTPLTIMKGELEHTIKTCQENETKAVFVSNLQEVEHLISLVKNLLLLARVDAGIGAMNLIPLYFEEVILDSISRAEKLARAKNIRIKFDIKSSSADSNFHPQIKGDEDLLQNLVFNLIENAIKYSNPEQVIAVSLIWEATQQILVVEDFGPGIPEQSLSLIFERFSRAENVGNRKGYGLGLAIAKQISLIHNGHLGVRNRLDAENKCIGSIFEFKIPNLT